MATVSFDITLDFTGTPKIFTFEDTSDYAGQGINLADVVGDFTITDPNGLVVHNNTSVIDASADIDPDGSSGLFNQTVIQVPITTTGFPIAGTWTVLYTVDVTGVKSYATSTFDYEYVRPEICINQTVDCISPLFTSADATVYTVDTIVPTIDGTHELTFPLGSGLSPESVSFSAAGSTITEGYNEFANGTQSTQITAELTYDFTTYTLIDSITAAQEIVVDCTDTCAIYCCLKAVYNRMMGYKGVNDVLYQKELMTFVQCLSLEGFARIAIRCGKSDDVAGYLSAIRLISNCTDGCSCASGGVSLVTGLGNFSTIVVVESGDAYITVTPVVSGSTTTYTVTLSSALALLIASFRNTVCVSGTNVTVTSSTTGITTTYTINAAGTIVAAGYGIGVSSATVGYNTTYTVVAHLVDTRAESTDPYTVTASNNQVIVGCTATAPTTGRYLIVGEADASVLAHDGLAVYRLYKNGTTKINADRSIVSVNFNVSTTLPYKMYSTCVVNLTAADTVVLAMDSVNTGITVVGRSITMIRIF